MGMSLTTNDLARYHSNGFHFPVPVLSAAEANDLLRFYQSAGVDSAVHKPNPHLSIACLRSLVCHQKITDAVAAIIGPDFFCLGARFFAKPPHSGSLVSWHQDAEYLCLSRPEVVTAWVAFTASTRASGCVRFIPGTHTSRVEHVESQSPDNMLSRGQELAISVKDDDAVYVELEPGQMSLHHPLIIHSSEPNTSSFDRIGFGIQYIPTSIFSTAPEKEPLLLVRGEDRFRYFSHV